MAGGKQTNNQQAPSMLQNSGATPSMNFGAPPQQTNGGFFQPGSFSNMFASPTGPVGPATSMVQSGFTPLQFGATPNDVMKPLPTKPTPVIPNGVRGVPTTATTPQDRGSTPLLNMFQSAQKFKR